MILPQSVKLYSLKYKILWINDFEQNFETFRHILYNSIFSYINSIINYIFLLAGYKVHFIFPCESNKSIFQPAQSEKNRVYHVKNIYVTRVHEFVPTINLESTLIFSILALVSLVPQKIKQNRIVGNSR